MLKNRLQKLALSWKRGEWGKSRWDKPVKSEAIEILTCPICQAGFVPTGKSKLCSDCC